MYALGAEHTGTHGWVLRVFAVAVEDGGCLGESGGGVDQRDLFGVVIDTALHCSRTMVESHEGSRVALLDRKKV